MLRRGSSTVQVPDGWLQLIRGPRPNSAKWPVQGTSPPKAPAKGHRGSQVASPQGVRGPSPEEVVSNARARVMKLEAAMAALGESDFMYIILQEALNKVKDLTHVRPVDERNRAKKRIGSCREEVVRAQEVLAQPQAKLQKAKHVWRPRCGVRGVQGGSSSDNASHHFLPKSWRSCEHVFNSLTGKFRSSLRAAVRRERRRKRSQTGQESVTFDPQFGPVEPTWSGLSEPAHFEHGTCRCFSQDGDVDRDCRCQFAFEPVQPIGLLIGVLTSRVPGRDGMKGG